MKFSWKIFILCVGIYIISLTITSIIVTENTYISLLRKEIGRSLDEERNLHSNLTLYLLNNKKISRESIHLKNYSQSMLDMFKTNKSYLEFFDERLNLLASNSEKSWFLPREELKVALEGKKNFILRKHEEKHFLFIADLLQIGGEKLIFCFIKDISHIDEQKTEQYLFFLQVGIIGLLFVALFSWLMSKFVMKPINNLSLTAQNIASGNYQHRVEVTNKDEIGLLAKQFNTMASEIEQKINQLEKESQRQQRFIDNFTHELRTPLTSIIGYAELLQNVEYDPKLFQKGLNYIYSEGKRILKLANTLMDIILLREKAIKLESHYLRPLLKEISEIMGIKGSKKNVSVKLEGSDIILNFDWDLMKSAIINLVDNAINASGPGQIVTLGTKLIENKVIIYVRDEGRGMDEKDLRKIKEPFYRVDKSRSRKEGGLGLGLAICQQIVVNHGAKLEIESKLNKGTEVRIIFNYN